MAERGAEAGQTGPGRPASRQTDRRGQDEWVDMPQSLFDWMSYGHHVARPPAPLSRLRNN